MFPKNLLQHTIKCFKSIFSGSDVRYHKVLEAGAPSYNSCCCSTGKKGSSSFKKDSFDTAAATIDNDTYKPENSTLKRKRIKGAAKKKVKIQTCDSNVSGPSLEIGLGGDQGGNDGKKEEARGSFVVEKLKEMKMMDERNSEHLMDIEEIIYYYSLITSQSFMEIVDKFFADLYSEFSDSWVFPGSSGGDRLVEV